VNKLLHVLFHVSCQSDALTAVAYIRSLQRVGSGNLNSLMKRKRNVQAILIRNTDVFNIGFSIYMTALHVSFYLQKLH